MSSQSEDHFACIGLVLRSNTTQRALQRKQKLKVDKERQRGKEGRRRQQHTDGCVSDGGMMTDFRRAGNMPGSEQSHIC